MSDFEQLKNNLQMQEEFIRGVMTIFASQEIENRDMCLKYGLYRLTNILGWRVWTTCETFTMM